MQDLMVMVAIFGVAVVGVAVTRVLGNGLGGLVEHLSPGWQRIINGALVIAVSGLVLFLVDTPEAVQESGLDSTSLVGLVRVVAMILLMCGVGLAGFGLLTLQRRPARQLERIARPGGGS